MSPTRQAVMPGDTLMGDGNSPLRHLRRMVVAEYGMTLKFINGRSRINATSGIASKFLCAGIFIFTPWCFFCCHEVILDFRFYPPKRTLPVVETYLSLVLCGFQEHAFF